jgi:hypothetical protein
MFGASTPSAEIIAATIPAIALVPRKSGASGARHRQGRQRERMFQTSVHGHLYRWRSTDKGEVPPRRSNLSRRL